MRNICFKSLMIAAVCTLIVFETKAIEAYKDTSLAIDVRVNDLISQMTLSEKISQLGHKSAAISRLGVSSYNYWNEALHGVARSGLATSFPQAIALSSTWNPELIYEVATAISDEARVKNNTENKGLTYWCPTINMARDPRWGRSEENYGEDVYLSSQIAVNFIKGMQGNHPKYLKTVVTAKHFACNNIETNRYGISSEVDERSLREYYLPVFNTCVKDAGVYSVMSAYNAVNGVPSPANRTLLTNILRNEWGFKGFVVSDCDAAGNVWDSHHYVATAPEATAISLRNGNDLNCGTTFPDNAQNAISIGVLKEEDINNALRNVFKARFLLGEFDPPAIVPYKSIPANRLDCLENRDLALRSSRESIVLLKNENSFLPLNKDSIQTIAVIGPNANAVQLGGYSGTPFISVSTLQGIAAKLCIDISNGTIEAEYFSNQSGIQTEACEDGGSNVGYIENGDYTAYDSIDFGTGKGKIDLRVASNTSGGFIEVLLDNVSGQSIGKFSITGTGGWQTWKTLTFDITNISGKHKVYLKFTGGSGYLFNLNWFRFYNTGDIDPTGGGGIIRYAAGCSITGTKDQTEFDKAISFARNSSVAVVVCGTDLSVADESHDRNTLALPGVQEQLIKEVFRANPNTIVVLVTGGSLSVNWAQDSIPAVLCAWYNGQSQGKAIAGVLFGDYNPGGKLTTTWFKSTADLPSMNDYDIKNNRTYMYFNGTPLYPFGHGLSYSKFDYSNLTLSSKILNSVNDTILVNVDIKNNSLIAGDEVVQLYVHANSGLIRPKKELKGFKRINLLPGETKNIQFKLKYEDLQYYDETTRTYMVENGNVDLYIGSSSEDIRLQDQFSTTSGTVTSTYRQNPFVNFEAENYENKVGAVTIKPSAQGGLCANLTGNNSFIVFKNLDFNIEAKYFNALISSTDLNSELQIVLDDLNGEVVGTINIESTANMGTYTVQSCELTGITGLRDVYIKLIGQTSSVCNIDWFCFQNTLISIEDGLTPEENSGYNFKVYPNPTDSKFFLNYKLPEKSDTKIEIYTQQGVQLYKMNRNNDPQGINNFQLNLNDLKLPSGIFFVKLSTAEFNKTQILNIVH